MFYIDKIKRLKLNFIFIFLSISLISPLYSQNLYINTNELNKIDYYSSVEVSNEGFLIAEGLYTDVLGRFLYSLSSREVYRVDLDKNGDIIKYYRQGRTYTPKFIRQGGRVAELIIDVPGSNKNQVRKFEYDSGKVIKQEIFLLKINNDGISQNYVRDQVVEYTYRNQLLIEVKYTNYNQERNETVRSMINYYNYLREIEKTEVYNQDRLVYYLEYNGEEYKHYKPSGELVREAVINEEGSYVINYYPAVLKIGNYGFIGDATDRYSKGQKTGFGYDKNGLIYKYYRASPAKNGFTMHEYIPMPSNRGDVIAENISYVKVGTWEKANTYVQKMYLLDPVSYNITALPFRWLDKEGNDLLAALPQDIRRWVQFKDELFIGAQYVIYGRIESGEIGNNAIIEVYNENGERNWCDLYGNYVLFVAKLSDNSELSFNKLVIRARGYIDYVRQFDTNDKDFIIDLGSFTLRRDL